METNALKSTIKRTFVLIIFANLICQTTPKIILTKGDVYAINTHNIFDHHSKGEETHTHVHPAFTTDSPAVVYTEMVETKFRKLPDELKNCERHAWDEGADRIIAICSKDTLVSFKLEKEIGRLTVQKHKKIGEQLPLARVGVGRESYYLLGLKLGGEGEPEISIHVFDKHDIEKEPAVRRIEIEDENSFDLGMERLEVVNPEGGERLHYMVIHHRVPLNEAGKPDEYELMFVLENGKADKIEGINLNEESAFGDRNAVVHDLSAVGSQLLLSYSREGSKEIVAKLCQLHYRPEEYQKPLEFKKCERVEHSSVRNPRKFVGRWLDHQKAYLAIAGETKEGEAELELCQLQLDDQEVKNCKRSTGRLSPLGRKAEIERIEISKEGLPTLYYADRGFKNVRGVAFAVHKSRTEIHFEFVGDGRADDYYTFNDAKLAVLKGDRYSVFEQTRGFGDVVIVTEDLEPGEHLFIVTNQASKKYATLEVQVLDSLYIQPEVLELIEIGAYFDELIRIPIDSDVIIGNGAEFRVTPEEHSSSFTITDVVKISLKVDKVPAEEIHQILMSEPTKGCLVRQRHSDEYTAHMLLCADGHKAGDCEIHGELRLTGSHFINRAQEVGWRGSAGVVCSFLDKKMKSTTVAHFGYEKTSSVKISEEEYILDVLLLQGPGENDFVVVSVPTLNEIRMFHVKGLDLGKVEVHNPVTINDKALHLDSEGLFCPGEIQINPALQTHLQVLSFCPSDPRVFFFEVKTEGSENRLEFQTSFPLSHLHAGSMSFFDEQIEFCSLGKELVVFDPFSQEFYSRSLHSDSSFFQLNPQAFGLHNIDDFACLPAANAFVLIGLDKDEKNRLAAVYRGDHGEKASTKLRRVVRIEGKESDLWVTGADDKVIITEHFEGGREPEAYVVYMRGPFIEYNAKNLEEEVDQAKVWIRAPEGQWKEVLTDSIEILQFEADVLIHSKKPQLLSKGHFNLEELLVLEGHLLKFELTSEKKELLKKVKLTQRINRVRENELHLPGPSVEVVRIVKNNIFTSWTDEEGTHLYVNRLEHDDKPETALYVHAEWCPSLEIVETQHGALAVLGCWTGNSFQLRLYGFPHDKVDVYVEKVEQVGRIDKVSAIMLGGVKVVASVHSEYDETETFFELEFEYENLKDKYWIEVKRGEVIEEVPSSGVRALAKVDSKTAAFIWAPRHSSSANVQIIGQKQPRKNKILLHGDGELIGVSCAETKHNYNSCTFLNSGTEFDHLQLTISNKNGLPKMHHHITFKRLNGLLPVDLKVVRDYTLVRAMNTHSFETVLVLYHHPVAKYVHAILLPDDNPILKELLIAYDIFEDENGEIFIVLSSKRAEALYKVTELGLEVSDGFTSDDGMDVHLEMIDHEGDTLWMKPLSTALDPGYHRRKHEKKGGHADLFFEHWPFWIIILVLIAAIIALYVLYKKRENKKGLNESYVSMGKDSMVMETDQPQEENYDPESFL